MGLPAEVEDEVVVCAKAGPTAKAGAVVSPRDAASGLPTGIVAFQRKGRRVRVTSLWNFFDAPSTVRYGAATVGCDTPMDAGSFDWARPLKSSGNEVAVEELSAVAPSTWRSIALIVPDSSGPQPPKACVKWPASGLQPPG